VRLQKKFFFAVGVPGLEGPQSALQLYAYADAGVIHSYTRVYRSGAAPSKTHSVRKVLTFYGLSLGESETEKSDEDAQKASEAKSPARKDLPQADPAAPFRYRDIPHYEGAPLPYPSEEDKRRYWAAYDEAYRKSFNFHKHRTSREYAQELADQEAHRQARTLLQGVARPQQQPPSAPPGAGDQSHSKSTVQDDEGVPLPTAPLPEEEEDGWTLTERSRKPTGKAATSKRQPRDISVGAAVSSDATGGEKGDSLGTLTQGSGGEGKAPPTSQLDGTDDLAREKSKVLRELQCPDLWSSIVVRPRKDRGYSYVFNSHDGCRFTKLADAQLHEKRQMLYVDNAQDLTVSRKRTNPTAWYAVTPCDGDDMDCEEADCTERCRSVSKAKTTMRNGTVVQSKPETRDIGKAHDEKRELLKAAKSDQEATEIIRTKVLRYPELWKEIYARKRHPSSTAHDGSYRLSFTAVSGFKTASLAAALSFEVDAWQRRGQQATADCAQKGTPKTKRKRDAAGLSSCARCLPLLWRDVQAGQNRWAKEVLRAARLPGKTVKSSTSSTAATTLVTDGHKSSGRSSLSSGMQVAHDSREARNRLRFTCAALGGFENAPAVLKDTANLLNFQGRNKQLIVKRSPIHAWGVYAGAYVGPEEFLIEYTGILMRQTVADVVERRYEEKGMDSTYFWRIDQDWVLDATHAGSVARFINHSCDPNCYPKIVMVNGVRKVALYSRTAILPEEELTYDYKLPIEFLAEKRVKCLCGKDKCRGFLN